MKYATRLATMLIAGAPLLAMAAPGNAEERTRPTVYGGQLTRSVTGENGNYSGTTTRMGANGATYTSSGQCVSGIVDRCARSYSATGPNGSTVTGKHATAVGPWRVRTARSATGPEGRRALTLRRLVP
ncbi:hypothetical protein ACC817_12455 [Rhizobium ruizarguesonis]|uniref:hypothetical protein n=1 Tax=Rhizobium ruizarguesonis TaxID=2081791 RepID=UPI00103245CE|nr:hypothetical protein [Rhizobium ruizarguesonis]TAY75076.1 hypothetical protein ELH84_14995 [Rhizobium ruizarguesonis]